MLDNIKDIFKDIYILGNVLYCGNYNYLLSTWQMQPSTEAEEGIGFLIESM